MKGTVMRKKGNLFWRMMAVLLCGMLMIGMTSQTLPAKVFAAETAVIEENTQMQDSGNAEQVIGTEEPTLPEDSEMPENSGDAGNEEQAAGVKKPESTEADEEQAAEEKKPESTEADEEQATEEKSDAGDEGQTETTEEPAVQESTQVQDVVNGDELSIAVLAQSADTSGSYALWVNGIQVTDENASNVLGDSTVSYAPDTNVLTLNGANLTTAYGPDSAFMPAAIYADCDFGPLKLNIQGTNTITASGSSSEVSGIFAMDSMEFSGDGSLTVTAVNQSTYGTGYAVYSSGYGNNVTITGGTYSFTGSGGSNGQGYGMYVGDNGGTVYVNGGTLTAKGVARLYYEFAIGGKLDVSGYIADHEVIASMDASGTPEIDYDPGSISYYAYIKVMPWIEPEYDDNGFCENENGMSYQPAVKADDGYYELTNAGNLYWFAESMKSNTASGYESVRLTEDITIPAGMNWKPISIGQWYMPYQGTFDGNGKSISNLNVVQDHTSASAGLFNTIGGDGVVKNLTMRNASIKTTASAGAICGTNYGTIEKCCNIGGEICVLTSYAGGIAGFNDGKIVRCFNTGTVYALDESVGDCVGGICGYASDCAVIENCYNTGTIGNANVQRAGGVTGGYSTGTKITGCYNIGTVTARDGAESIGCSADGSQPSEEDVKNNYYLAETESDDGGKTAEQFASGKVAWLLNEGNTDGTQAYYQTCGEGTPAFTGQTVYRVMSYRCPGDTDGKEAYSNTDENVTGEHSYGAWTVTKKATEDETGLKERNCTICRDKQTEVIPKTGGLEPPDSDQIEVDDQTGGDNSPSADDHSPADDTPPADKTKPDGTTPDGTKPGTENPDGTEADEKKPDETDADKKKPGETDADEEKPGETDADEEKPGETDADQTKPGGKFPHKEVPDGKTPGGSSFPDDVKLPDGMKLTAVIAPVTIEDGRIVIMPGTPETGEVGEAGEDGTSGTIGEGASGAAPIVAGNMNGMEADGVVLQLGSGEVIVTVICEGKEYTAGVRDTIAVANAVLTPEQIELVGGGGTIEILIDVKDITDSILRKDKEIIGEGIEAGRKDHPGLTLGMYIDISMFIKIGTDDWNAITRTEQPVDVVIGIPETLKADGREFTIIRSHDGTYALLPDTDENPDTITVSTNLFSAYAIAYAQADGNARCGLCHICPTFLGICCFIWLAVIVAVFLTIWILVRRRKKEEEQEAVK